MVARMVVALVLAGCLAGCDPHNEGGVGHVTLRVHDRDDVPVAGVIVVASDSDGTYVTHKTTDADGEAVLPESPDGSVTILQREGGAAWTPWLQTLYGVRGGDRYDILYGGMILPRTVVGSVELTIAGNGGTNYFVDFGGLRYQTTVTGVPRLYDVTKSAVVDPATNSVNVVVTAVDGYTPLSYQVVTDIRLNPATPTPVTIDDWRTDFVWFGLDVTGLPEPGSIYANVETTLGDLTYGTVGGATQVTPEPVTHMQPLPSSFGDGRAVLGRVGIYGATVTLHERAAGAPNWFSWDVGARTFAQASAVVPSEPDPGRPALDWSTTGDPAAGTALQLTMSWSGGMGFMWSACAPPTVVPPVQLPELPESLAAWRPPSQVLPYSEVQYFAASYADYDEFRTTYAFSDRPEPPDSESTSIVTRAQ